MISEVKRFNYEIHSVFLLKVIGGYTKAQKFSLSEDLVNSDIKIATAEYFDKSKKKLSNFSGTGFFFLFNHKNSEIPVIVTNKHFISDAVKGILYFKTLKADSTPNYTNIEEIKFENFKYFLLN